MILQALTGYYRTLADRGDFSTRLGGGQSILCTVYWGGWSAGTGDLPSAGAAKGKKDGVGPSAYATSRSRKAFQWDFGQFSL